MKARVLIVDDEPRLAAALAEALRRDGHACATALHGEGALRLFEEQGADVVVTDRRMPGMDGVELMRRLQEKAPDLPVILITAYGDVRSAVAAMREGAFDYLTKPFDNDELRALVRRALELQQLRGENQRLRAALEAGFLSPGEVVAESAAMRAALDRVDRAAASDAPVLLRGESGTGKEVVARRLHGKSARLGHPFVAINCRAFAPGVLESELFGHEKGAFTGAEASRAGCFERADGGTLFLDEIGEVEEAFQVKLLRVLQEGEVQRVGGDEPRKVDVRIVAATHRDLEAAMAEGEFREDLYYRLYVIPIHLPPLRERPEDILPLARLFLNRHARDGEGWRLGAEAEAALLAHRWPGNVRELENALERAVVLTHGLEITAEDLALEDRRPSAASHGGASTLQEAMEHAAAEQIRRALAATGGKKSEAADALGIDRTTLFRWLKRLGL
jgi:DNA-binding NtrC family response regulator